MISKITQNDLDLHEKWLNHDPEGVRLVTAIGKIEVGADLSGANLRGADLSSADLSSADLSSADLSGADLSSADLSGADLSRADLSSANLSGANLSGVNLSRADLSRADLSSADLSGADLSGVNLSRANLRGAKNAEYAAAITCIVPEGTLIGWKKLAGGMIAKLEIPAEAKRSNATERKCRAEFAKVLAIYDGDHEVMSGYSQYDNNFIYTVGQTVRPDKWDENRWAECSNGIHFFITRLEAENCS